MGVEVREWEIEVNMHWPVVAVEFRVSMETRLRDWRRVERSGGG